MSQDIDGQIAELISISINLFNAGDLEKAGSLLSTVNSISPPNFSVLKYSGIIAATKKQYKQAEQYMRDAVALDQSDALAYNVLSVCQFASGEFQEALDSADRAIRLRRTFAEAHNSRGNALNRLGRNDEALEAFKAAIMLLPGDLELHVNLGNALRDLGRPEEALRSIDRALAVNPNIAEAHYNRGNALQDLGRHPEAIESYDAALAIDANHVDTHWNRSLCNLLLGHFEEGWREYEWRWLRANAEAAPRDFKFPLWLGQEDLTGKSILLHCEQGLGDAIQFCRFAAGVAGLGATVYLETFAPLVELFGAIEGVAKVIPPGGAIPDVDFHCPLMSLPLAMMGQAAGGGASPPYLRASPEKVREWRDRLGAPSGFAVGVVCSGSPTHRNDHNRSIPLATLLGHLPAGPTYHLIQTDLRPADATAIGERPDVVHLGDRIRSFSDTAALCELMDLVVSVDTSVAHLAGAMNKPVWILLPYEPDWRWMLNTDRTPWYPSARLYRQQARRDWSAALDRMQADLSGRLQAAP